MHSGWNLKRREFLSVILGILSEAAISPSALANPTDNIQDFFTMCTVALSHEYGAIIQYVNHAGITKSKKAESVFLKNMLDEVKHAREIAKILIKEGGFPSAGIWPYQTDKKLQKLLQYDVDLEVSAVNLYSRMLEAPEAARYRDTIYTIPKDEELHKRRLSNLLRTIKGASAEKGSSKAKPSVP
ncbi:hypothetical protein Theam_1594 [Thermovibrio ammonificans HB-1]|uniref:Ferritin/DPS domain-containing protein n=1 Tax=Thermovibrio ammonificans (strain DSM 15698 / JCM 12110 / HB-1) TaxID=648996 RepID=E8T519_THEA1|nr:hypothetical protein Theam_1594 [Thermovibrio ammonificans HB-1]